MTDLEKAARAVSRVQRGPGGSLTANDMRVAVAVLKAVLTPSPAVTEEGGSMFGDMAEEFIASSGSAKLADVSANRVWRRMIHTIIGEPE